MDSSAGIESLPAVAEKPRAGRVAMSVLFAGILFSGGAHSAVATLNDSAGKLPAFFNFLIAVGAALGMAGIVNELTGLRGNAFWLYVAAAPICLHSQLDFRNTAIFRTEPVHLFAHFDLHFGMPGPGVVSVGLNLAPLALLVPLALGVRRGKNAPDPLGAAAASFESDVNGRSNNLTTATEMRNAARARATSRIAALLEGWAARQTSPQAVYAGTVAYRPPGAGASLWADLAVFAKDGSELRGGGLEIAALPRLAVLFLLPYEGTGASFARCEAALKAGVPCVWAVDAYLRTVRVHWGAEHRTLNAGEALTEALALPGLGCSTTQFFE